MATRLPHETSLGLRRLLDRLLERDLRPADVRFDAELSLHPIHQDIEMQLSHTRDDGLPGLLVVLHPEARIFFGELVQRFAHAVLVVLRLRLDGDVDHRLRERDRLEDQRVRGVAERVARRRVLQSHRRDAARRNLRHLFAMVRVHLHDPAHALGLLARRVVHTRSGNQPSRIHPEVCEPPDIRVSHDLERERREWLFVRRLPLHRLVRARVDANHRRHVVRRRQKLDDSVQQQLDALVLQRAAAHHRRRGARERDAPERCLDLVHRQFVPFDEADHRLLVDLADGLDHLVVPLLRLRGVLLRDRRLRRGIVAFASEGPRVHLDQIDNASEVRLGAHRNLDRDRLRAQAVDDHVDGAPEVRAHAVHLVHEADTGYAIFVRLPPHGLRLRLDARDRVEHDHAAVEHAQAALHLDREVDVTRRVDDVYLVACPLGSRRRRGDRDPPLALLLHPVHHRRAFVDLTDLVGPARVIENALGHGRLARINVSDDADVSDPLDWNRSRHVVRYCPVPGAASSRVPPAKFTAGDLSPRRCIRSQAD